MITMDTVLIESPYRGDSYENTGQNVLYARACLLDSLRRGEAPFASHLLYTQVLDDTDPEQRTLGINAGLAIGLRCTISAVYYDRGISGGILMGINAARSVGRKVELRALRGAWELDADAETICFCGKSECCRLCGG